MKKIAIVALVVALGMISSVNKTEAQFINVVLSITGNVVDKVTNNPIEMRVEAFDDNGNRVYYGRTKSENDGYYFITGLKPGKNYKLKLSYNKEYEDYEEVVSLPDVDSYMEIKKNIEVASANASASTGK
jgi:hypothetical protein